MVECKLISIEDLKKNNPRLCLSALRVFNKCEQCEKYESCESKVINKDLLKKRDRRKELIKQLNKIKKELKE